MRTTIPGGKWWMDQMRRPSEASAIQTEFDWLSRITHQWPVLKLSEIHEDHKVALNTVTMWVDQGRVLAFPVNKSSQAEREHLRIVRRSLQSDLRSVDLSVWGEILASVDAWLIPHNRASLTVPEAANCIRVTGTHIRDLVDAGHLRAAHTGSLASTREYLRIDRSSLVDWVRTRIKEKNNL